MVYVTVNRFAIDAGRIFKRYIEQDFQTVVMKKRLVQVIQVGLGILLIALTVEIIYMLYMRLDWTVTMSSKFIMWSFTLDLITSLILLLSFGYERYLYQRTMKTVMELQGKLESYGNIADLSEIQLDSYICTMETAAIMHRTGEISLKEFYSQFGYSLERLLRDSRANALMQKHICLNDIVYKLQKKQMLPLTYVK